MHSSVQLVVSARGVGIEADEKSLALSSVSAWALHAAVERPVLAWRDRVLHPVRRDAVADALAAPPASTF